MAIEKCKNTEGFRRSYDSCSSCSELVFLGVDIELNHVLLLSFRTLAQQEEGKPH